MIINEPFDKLDKTTIFMKTINKNIVDHLGDDFDNQTLIERKNRIDLQIEDYIGLYSSKELTPDQEEIIIETLLHLMTLESHFSNLINFINAINLN